MHTVFCTFMHAHVTSYCERTWWGRNQLMAWDKAYLLVAVACLALQSNSSTGAGLHLVHVARHHLKVPGVCSQLPACVSRLCAGPLAVPSGDRAADRPLRCDPRCPMCFEGHGALGVVRREGDANSQVSRSHEVTWRGGHPHRKSQLWILQERLAHVVPKAVPKQNLNVSHQAR